MTPSWTVDALAGPEPFAELAGTALGRPVDVATVKATPIDYDFGSPATAALLRVTGTHDDATPWSLFVKVLHHVRHWPMLWVLPPAYADAFAAEFPWRLELDAWEPGFRSRLPPGMRVPTLHRLVDLGDDRIAIWMEDITETTTPWDLDRYARAAYLLGRLGAAGTDPATIAACPFPIGYALRMWARRGLTELGVDPLGDDDLWHHPLLVAHHDLREELRRLAEIVPDLLDRLDALPQAMPHGDASPQNLLVPADAPDTFVAIDISFQTPLALGHDLGQLLVGLVHAGVRPAAALPELHPVLLDNYARGVADQGVKVSLGDIELGYVGSLLIRSGFTALPYGNLGPATPERLALTRFIVDTAKPLVT